MLHSDCATHVMAADEGMFKGQHDMAALWGTQVFHTKPDLSPLLLSAFTQACRTLHGSPVSRCGVVGLQECGACTRLVSLPKHCPSPCRSHPSSSRRWDALGKASAAHNKGPWPEAFDTRLCHHWWYVLSLPGTSCTQHFAASAPCLTTGLM